MSSNNNPEVQTPQADVQPAPATVTLSPDVTLGGRTFDLTKIDVQTGAELFGALPDTYRAQADALVPFFENYRREIANLPPELIAPGGVQKLMTAIKNGGGQLAADAPEWMKQSVATLSENAAVKSAQGVYDFFKTLSDSGSQFKDGLTWSLRGITALAGAAGDAASSYGKISHEQAVALAATYEAAIYKQSQTPEAGLLDKGFAGLETAMSWVLHSIYNIWPAGGAFLLAVKNFAVDGFKDWSQAYASADATLAQEGGAQSYKDLLQRDLIGKVNGEAKKNAAIMLSQVGSVADVRAGAMFQTLGKDDAVIVGQDAKVYGVHKGVMDVNPLPGPDGTPLAGKDLTNNRVNYVRGSLLTDKDPLSVPNLAGIVGATLGTTGAVTAVGLAGGGLKTAQETFQHAPLKRMEEALLKRHDKIEAAAKGANAGPRSLDPRSWFHPNAEKASARADYYEAIAAKEEASALRRGVSADTIEAAKKSLIDKLTPGAEGAVEAVAAKPSFWSNPIRWGVQKTGSLMGWAGDTAMRTVGGSVSQAQHLAGEVVAVVTKPAAAWNEASGAMKPVAASWTAVKGLTGFGLRRMGEAGMVLGALDDTKDTFNSAISGDGVGATRSAGRVAGGVGGTLAGGALATGINGAFGLGGAAVATSEAAAGAGLLATAAKGGLEGARFGKIARLPGVIVGGVIGIALAGGGYLLGRQVVGGASEGAATLVTGHGPRLADPGIAAAVADIEQAKKAAKLAMAGTKTSIGAVQADAASTPTSSPARAQAAAAAAMAPV